MCSLQHLYAREVLDSRGSPTIEVEAVAEGGGCGRASSPSGSGIETHAARDLRDVGRSRHGGRGVLRAVGLVASEIAPALRGMDVEDQSGIDEALIKLDGTPNKSRLGANTLLAVSAAVARAAAASRRDEFYVHLHGLWRSRFDPGELAGPMLPLPIVSMISGGSRAAWNLDFRDFMMIPVGARDFSEALDMSAAVYRALGQILHKHGHEAHLVGDDGAYAPRLWSNAQAVDHILEAILVAGLQISRDVAIAIDVAATRLLDPASGNYRLAFGREEHDSSGMIAMLDHWARQYPIAAIFDGLGEDDWDGWTALTDRLGGKVQVVGSNIYASQVGRIREGIDRRASNAVSIKPNQAGTLTEILDAIAMARRGGLRIVISARRGETEDVLLADLAVATSSELIKVGSFARSDRTSKYNRLLRIEDDLGDSAALSGLSTAIPTYSSNGHHGPRHDFIARR